MHSREIDEILPELAETELGREFLHWLMLKCGYMRSSIVLSESDEINVRATMHNETLRSFYILVREKLPNRLLAQIEYMGENVKCPTPQPQQTQDQMVQTAEAQRKEAIKEQPLHRVRHLMNLKDIAPLEE